MNFMTSGSEPVVLDLSDFDGLDSLLCQAYSLPSVIPETFVYFVCKSCGSGLNEVEFLIARFGSQERLVKAARKVSHRYGPRVQEWCDAGVIPRNQRHLAVRFAQIGKISIDPLPQIWKARDKALQAAVAEKRRLSKGRKHALLSESEMFS